MTYKSTSTHMETNNFLYFRDIRNDPKPQHEDTFSAPYDQEFFFKYLKHLREKHTDKCYEECFHQLNAHCKLPLQAQLFLKNPDLLQETCTFFKNNEKWRQVLSECLVNVFNNRSISLFKHQKSLVKDDLFNLIFTYLIDFPNLTLILEELWGNNNKLIDQNEASYLIKFEDYLKQALVDVKQRRFVGSLCECLKLLCQVSYTLQNKCLQLMNQYVLKLLSFNDIPDDQLLKILSYIKIQILQDTKVCCYLMNDETPQNLIKLLTSPSSSVAFTVYELLALHIQHYPQSLLVYNQYQEQIVKPLVFLVSTENVEFLFGLMRSLHRCLDGPMRGETVIFEQMINVFKLKGLWENVDGTY